MNDEEYQDFLRLKRHIDTVGAENAIAEAKAWWRRRMLQNLAVVAVLVVCVGAAWEEWRWITETTEGIFASSLIGAFVSCGMGVFLQSRLARRRLVREVILVYPLIALCWLSFFALSAVLALCLLRYISLFAGRAR